MNTGNRGGACAHIAETAMETLIATDNQRPAILLTGVTGGLGGAILPKLLHRYPEHVLILPIRADSHAELRRRMDCVVNFCGLSANETARLIPVRGDICQDSIGLARADMDFVMRAVDSIFHLAANVNFSLPLAQARLHNVQSAIRIAELALQLSEKGNLKRFNYVSTAYIAGDRRGKILESELNLKQGFFNSYEESKMEAEEAVEAYKPRMPVTIYRPSQVIGDSRSGRASKFFGMYDFIKAAMTGKLRALAADPDARMDIVPSDYVCDAMILLSCKPEAEGKTYHLAAGLKKSLSIRQIVELLYNIGLTAGLVPETAVMPRIVRIPALESSQSALRKLPPDIGEGRFSLYRVYAPYVSHERDFDVADTMRQLEKSGVALPPVDEAIRVSALYAASRNVEVAGKNS